MARQEEIGMQVISVDDNGVEHSARVEDRDFVDIWNDPCRKREIFELVAERLLEDVLK